MLISLAQFRTADVFEAAPRLFAVSSEVQSDTGYRLVGRRRRRETHAIFKYTLRGEGVIEDADGPHRVPEGSGFLCEVGDPEISYYFPADAKGPWEFIWIGFDGVCAIRWVREIIRRFGRVYEVSPACEAMQRICAWQSEMNAQKVIDASYGADLVNSLLLELINSKTRHGVADTGAAIVRRVQGVVAERSHENLNAKGVAALLNISREHLSRVFKKETGTSIHRYILDQKMEMASHLLRHSSMSGKEIAGKLGYRSPAHFSRTFKRVMRQSPREHRLGEGT